MKKNGYADTTIEAAGKKVRYLQKNCKTPQYNKSDYTTSDTTTQQCYTTKPKTYSTSKHD